jgi:hypothetical protein
VFLPKKDLMANTDVINLILSNVLSMVTYMLPVIALLSGVVFMVSWLMNLTLGLGRRVFKA